MRLLIILSFLSATLLCSCEEPYELGEEQTQIVIDSRVQAGRSPEVTVRVVNGFGHYVNSDVLQQSSVFIQPNDLEAIPFELGTFSDSSSSFISDCIIEAGERYTLLIQAPGFADLRSITEVPDNVNVRAVSTGTKGPNGGFLPVGDFFRLPLEFDDPKAENNFFHIVVTVRDADSDVETILPTTIGFRISPRPSDAKRYNETGWMFSDKDFSDNIFKAEIMISKDLVSQFPKPVVMLDMRSVSVDYFNYHIQNSRPKSDILLNNTQYGTIDNVAGGVGLFGGYSSNETSYLLEF